MRPHRLAGVLAAIPIAAFAEPPSSSTAEAPLRLSIEDAMRAVDRSSYPLAAARATSDRASADVIAARSAFLPQIALIGSYVRTLRSEYTGLFDDAAPEGLAELPFGRDHTWRGGVSASELLWDGGRTASSVVRAIETERVADLDVVARRAEAVLDVTDAYFTALLAASVVSIGEASLALAEDTLKQALLGYQQGTTAEFDVVRAEVTRDNQRMALVRSRADRDHAFLRLRQLLGIPFERGIELTSVSIDAGHVAEVARGAAGVHFEERVTVSQARANIAVRRAEVGLARASRWPTLVLVTDFERVSYPDSFWPEDDWRTNWVVGLSVTFPLFTGFRTTAEVRGARANQRAAEALHGEAVVQAALDEAQAVSNIEVAEATLVSSRRSSELARRAYAIAEVRYRQGMSTYLELVDARISLDQAQINEASAARDVAVTSVRLALLPALPVPALTITTTTGMNVAVTPGVSAGTSATRPPLAFPPRTVQPGPPTTTQTTP